MKIHFEDAIIVTKGLCYVVIGGLTPLATGLGQWTDTGEWPPTINWVVIGAGCCVGGEEEVRFSFHGNANIFWRL